MFLYKKGVRTRYESFEHCAGDAKRGRKNQKWFGRANHNELDTHFEALSKRDV